MAAGDPVTRYPLIDDTIHCLDPREVAAVCIQNGWALGDIESCNSLSVPVGMEAGRGYFVVKPTETIDQNAWHTIGWLTENGTTTWQNYVVIKRYVCGGDVDGGGGGVGGGSGGGGVGACLGAGHRDFDCSRGGRELA